MLDKLKKLIFPHTQLFTNFLLRIIEHGSKKFFNFILIFIGAKFTPQDQLGLYLFNMSIIFLIITFCDFGLSATTTKFIAEVSDNIEKVKKTIFSIFIIILVSTVGVSIIIFIFYQILLNDIDSLVYLPYLLPLVILIPMSSVFEGYYRGLKKFKSIAQITSLISIILVAITFPLIIMLGIKGILISQIIYYLTLDLFLVFKLKMIIKFDKLIVKKIIKYSILVGLSGIAFFLYTRLDILILGQFGYLKEITFYELVNQIFNLLVIPFTLLGGTIAPDVVKKFQNKEFSTLNTKFKKYSKLILISSIPISIVVYGLLSFVFDVIYTEIDVENTNWIIFILALLFPFKIIGIFFTQSFIISTGDAKYLVNYTLVGGLLNLILDYIFIFYFGFIGVFLVTLIIHGLINTLILFSYSNKLSFNLSS